MVLCEAFWIGVMVKLHEEARCEGGWTGPAKERDKGIRTHGSESGGENKLGRDQPQMQPLLAFVSSL